MSSFIQNMSMIFVQPCFKITDAQNIYKNTNLYLADPGEAWGCSINSFVINLVII